MDNNEIGGATARNSDGTDGGSDTDDSSILIISDTTLTVDEVCDTTYTVALRTKPTGDVTVTIGDPTNTDVTADPATLTFTPENWDEPQTVTVTCHEDDDEATITHTVDGPGLDAVDDLDVDVDITDNDVAGGGGPFWILP